MPNLGSSRANWEAKNTEKVTSVLPFCYALSLYHVVHVFFQILKWLVLGGKAHHEEGKAGG